MSGAWFRAHDGPMFTSYDTARALVADHQHQLQQEAVVGRFLRRSRKVHRAAHHQPPTHRAEH